MSKRDHKTKSQRVKKRPLITIDDATARDLMRIVLGASMKDGKPVGDGDEKEIAVTFGLNEIDAQSLEAHARRLGVSAGSLLIAAVAICNRELGGDPVLPETVEQLAKHGVSLLRKRDLS